MANNLGALDELVKQIDEFPIRDRKILKIQREMREMVDRRGQSGDTLDGELVTRYREALAGYFKKFHSEAGAHVREIDRRLERLAQLQFNATAERGVAARRVELTRSVLTRIEAL